MWSPKKKRIHNKEFIERGSEQGKGKRRYQSSGKRPSKKRKGERGWLSPREAKGGEGVTRNCNVNVSYGIVKL